ncbi:hypothetical protein [Arundinibacter roseus]|uniref:Uncharacterized protein n=1 Tax=Arundinibacter roseus TaxID=2070510 RepID=A0A4R4KKH7_9BACT|nr:hypothetical protein [Arundinibacter roseus]TDB67121.1 hypothetical protein EZE20_08385 [Arundinibacter roseus]
MAHVSVDSSKYKRVHGKGPRGFGCWAFQIQDEVFTFMAVYGKAKRLATRKARQLGVSYLQTLS